MKPEEHDFRAKIITFRKVFDISHKLSVQITNAALSFDIVIGIARGGVTPARLLCDFLNVETLTSLQIRHYSSGAQQLEKAEIIDPVDVEITAKNVLLVDDVNDSGKTLSAAVDHVKKLNPALIKTAVIHEKESSILTADFVGERQKNWKWLVYEWAVTEDVLGFLDQDDMLNKSERKMLHHLRKKYGLEMNTELFENVMKMRENYSKK